MGTESRTPKMGSPLSFDEPQLNQIEDLLLRLGSRSPEIGEFRDSEGQLRLVLPFPTWEDFLRLAFDEIRYCGAHSVPVMRRTMALVNDLISVCRKTAIPRCSTGRSACRLPSRDRSRTLRRSRKPQSKTARG